MAAGVKKRKPAAPEFPRECCGTCNYCMPYHDNHLCMVEPPVYVEGTTEPVYVRGAPVDPYDYACRDFKPRLHA